MKILRERSARRPLLALAAVLGTLLAAAAIAQSAVGLAAHEGDRTVAFGDVDDGYLDVEVAPDWLGEAEASLTLSDGTIVQGTLGHDGSGWLTFQPAGASTDVQFEVYLADVHATTARIELDDSVGPDEDERGPSGEGTTPNDDDGASDDGAVDDDDEGPTVVIRSGGETIGYGDLDDGRLDIELLPGRDGQITVDFDPGDGSGVVTYTGTVTRDGGIVIDGTSLEAISGLPVTIELDDSVDPDDDARDDRPGDDEARRGDDDDDIDDDRDDDDRDDDDGDRDDDEDGDRDDDAEDEGDEDRDRDDDAADAGDDDGDDVDEDDDDDDEDDDEDDGDDDDDEQDDD